MTEDPNFIVTATCVQNGMGDWADVVVLPEEVQLAFYYHCARTEGYNIDWTTGMPYRPT